MTVLKRMCVRLFVDAPQGGGMFANYNFKPVFVKPASWLFHFFVRRVPSRKWSQSIVTFLYKYSPED